MNHSAAEMHSALLILGSNLGDRVRMLELALVQIQRRAGDVVTKSSIYETAAWDMDTDNKFLNQAVKIQTRLSPNLLMDELLSIEKDLGRRRKGLVEDRTIDIDIAFYDDIVLFSPFVTIPHPRVHLRNFAMVPLAEIAGDYVHPVLNRNISTLLEESPDQEEVTILDLE